MQNGKQSFSTLCTAFLRQSFILHVHGDTSVRDRLDKDIHFTDSRANVSNVEWNRADTKEH